MDAKLTILFVLFGSIIGLSHLSAEQLARLRGHWAHRRWRKFVPARAKF